MPFLAEQHAHIPNKDLLSWTFDDLPYDQDKPVYLDALDPSRSISARQARSMIRKMVAGFRELGLKRGDCVCLHSPNDLYYPIVFLAVIAAGGIFAGTNVAYKPFELTHHLKTCKTRYVIAAPEFLESMMISAKELGIPNSNIVMFNTDNQQAPEGFPEWADLFKHGEQDWVRFDDQKTAEETVAALLFSSGTTGLPKGVMLSHKNFIAQHTLVIEHQPKPWESRRLQVTPLFHAAATPVACTTPLRMGEQSYIMKQFDLEKWFWAMEKYQITDMALVPPIAILIINSELRKKYSLKSVRVAYCGAAPLDHRPQARVQELLAPGAPFTQVWGMTETCCIGSMFHYPESDITGSVGHMLPNVDAKLVDDAGRDISGYDVRGELCVRGPVVTKGYYMNPEANASDFDEEGYFHTGDIAYRAKDTGRYYIVDRKKELIKVRGFQVAPPELEGVLLSHPDIVDVAVVGIQFGIEDSEFPRAYVVKRPGSGDKLTAEEVKKYIADRLVYYKRLEGGVVFVDAIPKTASGKILKRFLREQAAKETGVKL